ncbi:hypothetical protein SAMN04487977_101540 [Treponema bryantii]|uniref:Homeodomain-like domain-containing protein n=1 Tax=Treponema bryantii TaxID=163 RepID=A0A1H9B321_9SPIR|nr:hypothetical protein [Treponema bryantii]SEP82618.1 hypothetical protein SAMN04487977_101540 [Treponema bryantii]
MGMVEYKTAHLKPVEVQQMICRMSAQQIADYYGLKKITFWKWCVRHQIIVQKITDWELEEDIKIKTPKEIAYEHNITVDTVYNRLKKLGLNKTAQIRR